MADLTEPRLKLSRAEQHLDALNQAITCFIEAKPYTFALEPEPTPTKYALMAKINHRPPLDWGLLIGDFAHNCRSALDVLVYQLSALPKGDPRKRKLSFPICDMRTRSSVSGQRGYTDLVNTVLAGVTSDHSKIIEGFQPYHRSSGVGSDLLALLRELNDSDKHRIIQTVGSVGRATSTRLGGPRLGSNVGMGPGAFIRLEHGASVDFGGGFSYVSVGNGEITDDDTKVAELTIGSSTHATTQPNVQIEITFRKGGAGVEGRPVMQTLTSILDRVRQVVAEFE
ncbi:MAG: hypothetical protein O6941_01220 [Planctomycetota bacterium]|nr:hypothetical protein [Planctomycetota bacterium]